MNKELLKQYPFHIGVCGVIISEEKILLLKRSLSIFGGGFWCLPAGHVERGESAQAALIRELNEELGIECFLENLDFMHVAHVRSHEREYVTFYFRVNAWQGEIYNSEPDKHDELLWCDWNNLPDNLLNKELINTLKSSPIKYSQSGW